MVYQIDSLIGGHNLGPSGDAKIERFDPVTGELATLAASATVADAQSAVEAASTAFPAWKDLSPSSKRDVLNRAAVLVAEQSLEFGRRMLSELGFPASVAARNVHVAVSTLREAAAITTQIRGEILPTDRPETLSMVVREPRGVVLAIAPWNAPLALGVRAIAVALACGNTVVLKGSERSPATHRLIADIMAEAGLPVGVLNLINCLPQSSPGIVEALIADPRVRHVNFTGSTKVGRIIGELAGRHLKPSLLELGGKAPVLVFDDADLDAAAGAVATAAFTNQGQICMSTERVIVQESIADAFVDKLKARTERLRVGDPREAGSQLGALVGLESASSAARLVANALSEGAELVCGNSFETVLAKPTVIDHVTPKMDLYYEESFGPIVCVVRVKDDKEAIAVANDSEYGLSAAIFSRDVSRALRAARTIRSGICHINSPTIQAEPQAPFGGVGASGFGRFGGSAEVNEFTELRWITVADAKDSYPF